MRRYKPISVHAWSYVAGILLVSLFLAACSSGSKGSTGANTTVAGGAGTPQTTLAGPTQTTLAGPTSGPNTPRRNPCRR